MAEHPIYTRCAENYSQDEIASSLKPPVEPCNMVLAFPPVKQLTLPQLTPAPLDSFSSGPEPGPRFSLLLLPLLQDEFPTETFVSNSRILILLYVRLTKFQNILK